MDSSLTVWPDAAGIVIRLRGSGTARCSVVLKSFVEQSLANGIARIEIDGSECSALDSTFLGCLVHLYQRNENRFALVNPSPAVRKVLHQTKLDGFLPLRQSIRDCQAETGIRLPPPDDDDPLILGQHVLDCHRALLAVDGPHQAACEAVVSNLAAALGLDEQNRRPPGR